MSTFTPSPRLNADTSPRDWAYELGALPQTVSIVFTKSSLIAFLKTHGIEVGPNNSEISKVPRYALIGTMEESRAANLQTSNLTPARPAVTAAPLERIEVHVDSQPAESIPPRQQEVAKIVEPTRQEVKSSTTSNPPPAVPDVKMSDAEAFRPTRRVREPIGGGSAQIAALFGIDSEDHDEVMREAERENAKRRGFHIESSMKPVEKPVQAPLKPSMIDNQQVQAPASIQKSAEVFRPTRRVREPGGTGGKSSFTLG